jgi:hypothetical protein
VLAHRNVDANSSPGGREDLVGPAQVDVLDSAVCAIGAIVALPPV